MTTATEMTLPSEEDKRLAENSIQQVKEALIHAGGSAFIEVELDEGHPIKIPRMALKMLFKILQEIEKGNAVSIIPVGAEVTTQKAAELLGFSRPYIVKLLEEGKIPFRKIGRHRRVMLEDVLEYKKNFKREQREILNQMIAEDQELGLYD